MPALTLLGDFGLVGNGCTESPPRPRSGSCPARALGQARFAGFIVGTLWLDTSDQQAGAGLRSAMWRLRKARPDLVVARPGHRLGLGFEVSVGVHRLVAVAEQLRSDAPVDAVAEQYFEADLLPDWDDEWLAMERVTAAPDPPRRTRAHRRLSPGRRRCLRRHPRRHLGGALRPAAGEQPQGARPGPHRRRQLRRGHPPVRALPPVPRRPPRPHAVAHVQDLMAPLLSGLYEPILATSKAESDE